MSSSAGQTGRDRELLVDQVDQVIVLTESDKEMKPHQ